MPFFANFGALNFVDFKSAKIHKKSNFRAPQFVEMADFETLDSPILIWCKIWVTEKSCNFHTVCNCFAKIVVICAIFLSWLSVVKYLIYSNTRPFDSVICLIAMCFCKKVLFFCSPGQMSQIEDFKIRRKLPKLRCYSTNFIIWQHSFNYEFEWEFI